LPITHDVFALQGEKYSATLTNGIWETKVNKQVQIASDITNNQDRSQPFAVPSTNSESRWGGSIFILAHRFVRSWSIFESFSIMDTFLAGTYNAQIFVWAGINNPDALSVPLIMKITVT